MPSTTASIITFESPFVFEDENRAVGLVPARTRGKVTVEHRVGSFRHRRRPEEHIARPMTIAAD